jgi:sugar lactone lactonase YvrE
MLLAGGALNSPEPVIPQAAAAEPAAHGSKAPKAAPSPAGEGAASQPKGPELAEPAAQPEAQTEPDQQAERESEAQPDEPALEDPFPNARAAPDLSGGVAWINTAGPIELRALRGKFVLLDFWTYCCINCMHILPELKKLEQAYPNEIVVIGVHSAKFETEQDARNITEAVLRYEIEHPVVNDADHVIWNKYLVNSWPSLRVIDPEGRLVAGDSGEITFEVLDAFFRRVIPYYRKKGVLDETPLRFDLEHWKAAATPLRYPGKVLADEASGRLFISDSNHNRIVVASLDGRLLDIAGSGAPGAEDGPFDKASFNHPQGMVLRGQTLYVADTENHLLRAVDLDRRTVRTVAGVGTQARGLWPGVQFDEQTGRTRLPERFVGPPRTTALNSPWDLWIHGDRLYIAMAGPHQIWFMDLTETEIGPYAGNGREDIVDGPLLPNRPYDLGFASFAQPSGLASDGTWLYVADSEGSSLRAVPFDAQQEVQTIIGTAHLDAGRRLFTFGDVDGPARRARLQHPLGVAWYQGQLYVADTYNHKIKVVDVERRTCRTLAGDGQPGAADSPARFYEPGGLSAAAGKLYVADTNNHVIRTINLDDNAVATLAIEGLAPPAYRPLPPLRPAAKEIALPEAVVRPSDGMVILDVHLALPEGQELNPLAPMRYLLEAVAEAGPLDRQRLGQPQRVQPPADRFRVSLPLAASRGSDRVRLSLSWYYCDQQTGTCKEGTAAWVIPLRLDESAPSSVLQVEHQPH